MGQLVQTAGTTVRTTTLMLDGRTYLVRLDWTSNGSGVVTCSGIELIGVIQRVVFNPGGTAPTDNYDVTITDSDGADVLAGCGADLDTANTEQRCPVVGSGTGANGLTAISNIFQAAFPVLVGGDHTLNIANAGDSKVGSIAIYLLQNDN